MEAWSASAPKSADGTRSRDVWWFDETVTVPADAQELLEKYSGLQPDEVKDHIVRLRNKAWDVCPFHCLGRFRFLELNLSLRGEVYDRLVDRLKGGQRLVDIGPCLGQDIRKLVYDGVPGSNIVGVELQKDFVELGYDMFRDRGKLEAQFVVADILDDSCEALRAFEGKMDVVHLGMILHVFSWDQQVQVFKRSFRLAKPDSGAMIIGLAVGNVAGAATGLGDTFKHNVQSFEKLVASVSEETGTRWTVRAALQTGVKSLAGESDGEAMGRLAFEVERL